MTIRKSQRVNPLLDQLKTAQVQLVCQKEYKWIEDLTIQQIDTYMQMPILREKLSFLAKECEIKELCH